LTRFTFCVEILLTVIGTIVIGYIAKNILEKKLNEQEQLNLRKQADTKYLLASGE